MAIHEPDQPGVVSVFYGRSPETSLAATGQMARLGGRNHKVLGIWFLKAPDHFGEEWGLSGIREAVDIFPMYPPLDYNIIPSDEEVQEKVARGMKLARESWNSREYDLIVMDEVLTCCENGQVTWDELHTLLDERPDYMHVTLTGIAAPDAIKDKAHTLIHFDAAKHHLDSAEPRKGFDR